MKGLEFAENLMFLVFPQIDHIVSLELSLILNKNDCDS